MRQGKPAPQAPGPPPHRGLRGLFVAVQGDDENYIADFPGLCKKRGVYTQALDPADAREMEPCLSKNIIAAFQVKDGAIDPFGLSFDNLDQAQNLGCRVFRNTRAVSFSIQKGKIAAVDLENRISGEKSRVYPQVVINAAGALGGQVAALAGVNLRVICSKGTLAVTQTRISNQVVNRLRRPTDADILVPGGTVSVLGTTSLRVRDPDNVQPGLDEIDHMIDDAGAMVPALKTTRYIRAYCGVRPLVSTGSGDDDREVSRGFVLLDHEAQGVENFLTISGGKLTTFRLMAAKTADKVCQYLGKTAACSTDTAPLPQASPAQWTDPQKSLRVSSKRPDDLLLCECEMVSQSTVDEIAASLSTENRNMTLLEMGQRSRMGKGPCQGTFCSQRVTAHLYSTNFLNKKQGLHSMRAFLEERWRGQRPVLWGVGLAQRDLAESLHCGLFGLELVGDDTKEPES